MIRQPRMLSLIEVLAGTAVGLGVALATQLLVFPLFGFDPPLSHNLAITAIFTAVSLARQYAMRRLFEALHVRRPVSAFASAVLAERWRQIEVEGWSSDHDDREHRPGELARAGGAYALHAGTESGTPPHEWPWADGWWKPSGFRRDLVKAAALVLAEGERFDRDRKRGRGR